MVSDDANRDSEPGRTNALTSQRRHFAKHFLALSQLRGLGVQSIQTLIDHYGDLGQVWTDDTESVRMVLAGARIPGSTALAERIRLSRPRLMAEAHELLEYFGRHGIQVVERNDPLYPERLRSIPDHPYWLFVEGDPSILTAGEYVAIVGARDASSNGVKTADHLAWLVAKEGLGIVSGLAEGIDAAAHSRAIRHQVPQVAVLGTGINVTFPTTTAQVRRRIVDTGGCVITEYLPSDNYGKGRFVQRNRIQAGLAVAVCPLEGRAQSGTMHTVRFALKYERALFGVTRGILSPENDMPIVVRERDAPVFAIDTEGGRREFREFLDRLPDIRWPSADHSDEEWHVQRVSRLKNRVLLLANTSDTRFSLVA